jgi:GH15 family glucan-1,4-alpha-glucosidase
MEAKLKRPEGKPAEGHALHSRAALRGIKHEGEYLPIEDHGIVGNMRTVALVGRNATIDWMCFPHFDSPSIFGSLLDSRKGGHWSISPVGVEEEAHFKQYYWLDTNVLVTRISTIDGIAQVVDYMPVGEKGLCVNGSSTHNALIRQLSVVHGKMCFKVVCKPGFNYARDTHEVKQGECGVRFYSESLNLCLFTPVATQIEDGAAVCEVCLKEGDTKVNFILCDIKEDHHNVCHKVSTDAVFEGTIEYWHNWLTQCTYKGRWREMVYRSALVMKLLTFAPTGAIVAAPTCSLPEDLGGERNWDYRYTWLRDAAFTLYGFLRIGFYKEASAFMGYLEVRCKEVDEQGGQLQPLYGIHGESHLPEFELDHMEGYKGSRPVRVGNGAYNQVQMDIYGELLVRCCHLAEWNQWS